MSKAYAFYLCKGYQLLDLAGPMAALESANRALGRTFYTMSLISDGGGDVQSDTSLFLATQDAASATANTVVAVGGVIGAMREPNNVAAMQIAAQSADNVASICTGAFLLAAAGLLDHRRATTHWQFAPLLAEQYPFVRVDADRIFINDGPVWTSAGMTAGIDLMLAQIEVDHGQDLAKEVSRDLVVYYRRPGGQSQFAAIADMEPQTDRIRKALAFARDHLAEPISTENLADAACLSVRQFNRLFKKETGETPARAVERLRCEAARTRLRDGSEPISAIARAVGFSDTERMRAAFVRSFGHSPQMQRRLDTPLISTGDGGMSWPP